MSLYVPEEGFEYVLEQEQESGYCREATDEELIAALEERGAVVIGRGTSKDDPWGVLVLKPKKERVALSNVVNGHAGYSE
jgi:hypothetical protein